MLHDSTPYIVRLSIRWLGTLDFFFGFCGLWTHCSCPSDQVTTNTAPAYPHATGVAVYLALFSLYLSLSLSFWAAVPKGRYTGTPVACRWAWAIFDVTWSLGQEQWVQRPQKTKKSKVWQMDGRTDKTLLIKLITCFYCWYYYVRILLHQKHEYFKLRR